MNIYIRDFKESQRNEYINQIINNRPELVMQACKDYNEMENLTGAEALNPLEQNDAVTALESIDVAVATHANIDKWELA